MTVNHFMWLEAHRISVSHPATHGTQLDPQSHLLNAATKTGSLPFSLVGDCFFLSLYEQLTLWLGVIVFDNPQSYNPCQNDVRRHIVVKIIDDHVRRLGVVE